MRLIRERTAERRGRRRRARTAARGRAEEEIAGVAHADPASLTPQGRLRDAVTENPDFTWELPNAGKLLTRSTGEQARPDTAGQERIATSLVEALGHFGVRGEGDRHRRRTAHHAL